MRVISADQKVIREDTQSRSPVKKTAPIVSGAATRKLLNSIVGYEIGDLDADGNVIVLNSIFRYFDQSAGKTKFTVYTATKSVGGELWVRIGQYDTEAEAIKVAEAA